MEMLQLSIAIYQAENENEYNKINYFRRIVKIKNNLKKTKNYL